MSRSYTSSPLCSSIDALWDCFTFYMDAALLLYEPGSSGSIVSDYGLDDRAIGVRSPAGAKDFSSSLCVQTGSEVHPASCTLGTEVLSPWLKRGRGVTLTTHPHLVPRTRMSRSYTSSPPSDTWRVAGLLCFALYPFCLIKSHPDYTANFLFL
jgi:hypothetical protein